MSWRDRPYAEEFGPGGQARGRFSFSLGGGGLTPAVKWLVIVNVAVMVLSVALHAGGYTLRRGEILYVWGNLDWGKTIGGQVWRLVTYQYLHASPMHLIFNMLVLWFVGPLIERQFGSRTFFAFYTLCGVVAGLAFMALVPAFSHAGRGSYVLIGASGSIMGVLAAGGMIFPHQVILLFMVLPMKLRTLVIGLAGVYLLTVIASNNLSDAAHLGGMVGAWAWITLGRRYEGRGLVAGLRLKRSAGRWERQQREIAAEQAKVDRILAKVHDHGIRSLTWFEKRTLRKATERERQREKELDRRLRR